jgi:hypothetical protein
MTPPAWVQALIARHHRWVMRAMDGPPLTEAEAMAKQRDYGLLYAWEQFDGGEGLAYLELKLLARALEEGRDA